MVPLPRLSALAALAALMLGGALLGGCDAEDAGPVEASVIGPPVRIVDPAREALSAPTAVLLGAIAQGLVRFDDNGQIEPGLAERWIVSDDGKSYLFRLADLHWTDGTAVTTEAVARRLRAAIAATATNPDRRLFAVVDEVLVMTDQVIEIRLKAPRPNMLQLLAQPEMALLSGRDGTGPMRIEHSERGGVVLLTPVDDGDPDTPPPAAEAKVRLRGEKASRAIARYQLGRAHLVLGGTYANLLMARVADIPSRELRVDPTAGLFGIEILSGEGFLAIRDNRAALSMAIDRTDLLTKYAVRGWTPTISLTPDQLDSAGVPTLPPWNDLEIEERRRLAASRVAAWRVANPLPTLRMAVADAAGARLLFSYLRASWAGIGITLVAVPEGAKADFAVIDDVAPMDSISWYLDRVSCARGYPCDPVAEEKRLLARSARTLDDRAVLLAEAEAAASDSAWFIPIAPPLRWSLVSPRLSVFRENPRATHPLNRLRPPPR